MKLLRHAEVIDSSSAYKSPISEKWPEHQCISAHRYSVGFFFADILILFLMGTVPAVIYDGVSEDSLSHYISIIGSCTIIFLLVSRTLNIYETASVLEWHRTIPKLVAALLGTFLAAIIIGVATKTSEGYSRVWFGSWAMLSLTVAVGLRMIVLAMLEARLAKGACLKRALIISCGYNTFTEAQLALETRNRVRSIGTIVARDIHLVPDLLPYIQCLRPDVIIISLPWAHVEDAIGKFHSLSRYAIEVLILPDASTCLQRAIRLRHIGTRALLQIVEPPLADWDQTIKRVEDVLVATLALIITLPLMIMVAIAIKLESKGPVLFKQARIGLDGDLIDVWKFRSMYVDAADDHAFRQTSRDDPRVTRVGRFIRRTSVDELPQFWNVLQGQMSVVGPRPHALKTAAEGQMLETIVDEYVARHRIKPGITGWAQINGARGELCSREQVKLRVDYDLYYIDNWSIYFDIKIILMTVVRAFYDPHAY